MQTEFKAILTDDHLEWKGERPKVLVTGQPAEVVVTISTVAAEPSKDEMRRRRVAALRNIAAEGGIPSIPDAVAWQREMREDRKLPGREE